MIASRKAEVTKRLLLTFFLPLFDYLEPKPFLQVQGTEDTQKKVDAKRYGREGWKRAHFGQEKTIPSVDLPLGNKNKESKRKNPIFTERCQELP